MLLAGGFAEAEGAMAAAAAAAAPPSEPAPPADAVPAAAMLAAATPEPPPAPAPKAPGETMRTPRLEVRLKGGNTVRPVRRARERITPGAGRTPKLHQFSQSARLQRELVAASQLVPEPEPEPEQVMVPGKRNSLAQERANVKRNPPMKAQTPRLRAKAVAKAAVDSQWPNKNVSSPRQPERTKGRLADRAAEAEEEPGAWTGRPAPGRPDELGQRVPPHKIAEILGGLQELSDNAAVQRALENSIAGHSGLYIPKRERMLSRWGSARTEVRHIVRTRQALVVAQEASLGRKAALAAQASVPGGSLDGAGMTGMMADAARGYGGGSGRLDNASAEGDVHTQAEHALKLSEHKSMFERFSVVSNAERVMTPRGAAAKFGIPPGVFNQEVTALGSSRMAAQHTGSSGRKPAFVPALPALAAAPPKPASKGAAAAQALRQLRAVLEVHPATAHKHFTAEHLVAIQHLIDDGMPVHIQAPDPALSSRAGSASLTSAAPGEFETIHAGDIITVVINGEPVCREVLPDEQPVDQPLAVAPSPPPTAGSKPRMSRAILKAIFEKLDQNGDGVVDEQELLYSVAADETLAQLLRLPPATPKEGGRFGMGVASADGEQHDVAAVQAVMTGIVKTNKANHDAEVKAAMIDLVSPRGGSAGAGSAGASGGLGASGSSFGLVDEQQPQQPALSDTSLEISTAAISIPDRDILEAMEPDAVRQLALDVGISPEQVGAAAPPRQVGFEEFAQFLESLVLSTATDRPWSVASPRKSPRGRPDTPDTLLVDSAFADDDLNGVSYTVSRHLRPVAEWGLDVDLPGVERPDGITWEAVGVLPPQIRPNITSEEIENGMMLAQLTPRMETVNRDNNKKQQHSGRSQLQFGQAAQAGPGYPVARPPKDARVYKGPASLRGRQMRAVGVANGWKC